MNNSTIVNNIMELVAGSATPKTGGIAFGFDTLVDPRRLIVSNSIISGNRGLIGTTYGISNCGWTGGSPLLPVTSYGYNMIETGDNCAAYLNHPSTIIASASLGSLADNGGFSFTHALSTTPPIDSGNPATSGNGLCSTSDQRGALRLGQCDIGAYEANASLPPANQAPIAGNDLYTTAANTSISALLTANDSDPENKALSYHLQSFPNNGYVRLNPDGNFTYSPMAAFSGTDSFSYLACDVMGQCSTASVSIVVDTAFSLPAAPSLSLASAGSFVVNLSWLDNSNDETSFVIERRANGGAWRNVGTVAANALSFTDENLFCVYPYDYRVRAYRASDGAYSAASNIISATTSACPPPANFTGVAAGYTSLQLSWEDNLKDETAFILEFSTNNGTSWQVLPELSANTSSYNTSTNLALSCGTSYQFRIKSKRTSPAMTTAYSPVITVATNDCPPLPNAPTNLTSNASTYTSISLQWQDTAPDDAGFQIHRSVDGGVSFTALATTGTNQATYSHTTLSCGVSYQYKVRTIRTSPVLQYSEFSNTITASTSPCPPPPNLPSNLTASDVRYTSVMLNWTDTNSDESNYRIERSTDGGLTWTEIVSRPANYTSYYEPNLQCSSSYLFRMRAYRATPQALYSDYTASIAVTTVECPPLPNPPTELVALSSGTTSISLSWTDTNTDELQYILERSTNGGTTWTVLTAVSANTTTYSNTGLSCNTTYKYRVRAYRVIPISQWSLYSDVATASTDVCPPIPTAPSGLTAAGTSNTTMGLNWVDNATNEDGYYVERSPNGTSSWTQIGTVGANITSYSDSGLSCVTTYYYRVRASNAGGNSVYSAVASAATLGCAPSTPSSLSATNRMKNSLTVNWFDNASNETAYYVERSADSGASWTQIASLGANATSYGDSGLNCNTGYQYRVRAYRSDANAYSNYSATLSTSTTACTATPATPTNIVLDPLSSSSMEIRWTDNATNETSYRIQRSTDTGTSWTQIAELPANSTSYTDSGRTCGTSLRYRVSAFNSSESSSSAWLSSSNTSLQCPPANFVVELTSRWSIKLDWGNTSSPTTSVRLERSSDGGMSWIEVASVSSSAATHYTNSGLQCGGTNYQYRARAFASSTGEYSDYTAVISTSTLDCYGLTETTCTFEQINTSHNSGVNLGPVYLSGDGSRLAMNYQNNSLMTQGLFIYDVATGALQTTITPATASDIAYDGTMVFLSTGNHTGQNADGSEEIFLWNNGTFTQITSSASAVNLASPKISDDGSTVVFYGPGNLVGQPATGKFVFIWDAVNGLRKLINTAYTHSTTPYLDISGDGSTVSFIHNDTLSGQNLPGDAQLYIWNATDGAQLVFASSVHVSLFPYSLMLNTDGSVLSFGGQLDPLGLNTDKSNEIFVWTEGTGLRQITEGSSSDAGYIFSMDGSGQRLLLGTNLDVDSDSTYPVTTGLYLFDEGYGFSQLTSHPDLGSPSWGTALSQDGNTVAILNPAGWDYISDPYSYMELFVGTCTPADNLPSPDNLESTENGETVNLSWNDKSLGETAYYLERSSDGGTSWTELAMLPADSTSYNDEIEACTEYAYRVRGYRSSDAHYSDYSNVELVNSGGVCLPDKPTNLSIDSISETAISMSWTDNATDENAYHLERSTDGGTTWTEIAQLSADSTGYEDNAISCGMSYSYRLRAYRSADDAYSKYSNIATAATEDCAPPLAPSALTTSATGANSISLSWTDNPSDETAHLIERSTNGISWTELASLPADSSGYTDNGLTCTTAYQYRVRVYRANDEQFSAYSDVLTANCAPPPAPTDLVMSSNTQTSITLNWTDNASNETGYRVERSADNGLTWTQWTQLPANTSSYTNSLFLTCSTTYLYRLRAYRSGDNQASAYANITASTAACPPLVAPSNLSLTLDSAYSPAAIQLSWTDSNSTESNFRIERSTDAGTSWTVINGTTGTSYVDSDLLCGTSYSYRVRAYRLNDDSYSPYSSVETIMSFDCATALAEEVCTFTTLTTPAEAPVQIEIRMSGDGQRAFIRSGYPDYEIEVWDLSSKIVIATIPHAMSFAVDEDGSRVAFISGFGGNIYLWDNGSISQITDNASMFYDLSISSDGTKIAFIISGNNADRIGYWEEGIGLVDILPEVQHPLTLAMSGDGNKLAFTSYDLLVPEAVDGYPLIYFWDEVNGISSIGYPSLYDYDTDQHLTTYMNLDESGENLSIRVVLFYEDFYDVFLWNAEDGFISLLNAQRPEFGLGSSYDSYEKVAGMSADGQRILLYTRYDLTGENPDLFHPNRGAIYGEYFFYESGEFRQITSSIHLDYPPISYAMSQDGSRILAYTMMPSQTSPEGYAAAQPAVVIGDCEPLPLAAPTGLTIDSTSENSISLEWTDNASDETEYRLERSDDGISWTEIEQLPANTESYTDSSLDCNTSYDYRLRAYRSSDTSYSAYSNVVTGTTDTCLPPAAPSGLIVTGTTETSVSLSWTDNASNETSYSLERSLDGLSWVEVQALAANSTSFENTGLNCNTSYQYRIRAYRSGDSSYSSYSNVATGTTSACPAPLAPTALSVTGTSSNSVSLAWTDNSTDESQYRLERSADSGASWTEIAQPAANATSYSDTTVACNTSYDYRVRAYRAGDAQFSDYSNVATGTTSICITLNAPSNIQLTASTETSLSMSWTDNSTNESGYEVERSLDGTNWSLMSSLPADSTSYTDSGLTCSTGYQYRIRSNHIGTGTYSPYGTSGTFTTVSCPALVASVLSNTGSTANSISLNWTVDSSGTSFTLAYYNGASWVNLGIFPASTTSYTHNGLSCGTSYPYQVTTLRAGDSASVTSSAFSTSTAACAPLAAPNAPVVLNTEPALVSLQIPALPATATSMSLERSTDGLSWMNLGAVSSNYIDTAVICGSSYQYRLVATRSSDGVTSTSATAVALTDACPIPTVLGVYRGGLWVFVDSNNTATPVNSFNFGDSSWQALVGDWDGDGIDGVGIYRNGEFALRNIASADSPENRFNFGNAEAGWQAIVGDWDGNGTDTVGLYKDGLFILSNDNINSQYRFNFGGGAGWQALAGDWDGNGADGIGLYKDGMWMLAEDVNNPGGTTIMISYGPAQAGWTAIVGDWNGDGRDSIGLYSNGLWRMRVSNIHDTAENSVSFGQNGDIPLAIFEN